MKAARFRPCLKNTLLGFFDLELSNGLIPRGCTLHLKNGQHWVGLPGKPYKGADGTENWANVVDFADKATRDRFQKQATAAALAARQRSEAAA
jgi:hypothetical protein